MATKEQLLAAIKDGSFFDGFEVGRTARLKQERIEQIADAITAKIIFVGPLKPIEQHSGQENKHGAYGYDNRSGIAGGYTGD